MDPARAEVERRVENARDSISQTVEQIKGTVNERVDAVATTVSGVLTMSEQFQREPVAWSLGALSAGFAIGYGLGRAHHAKTSRGRRSPGARLADDVAAELATFGSSLVSPALTEELKTAFGVDLTAALAQIAAKQAPTTPSRQANLKRRAKRRAAAPRRKRS
jgi:hypothetical protein